jgi:hypothetical protein
VEQSNGIGRFGVSSFDRKDLVVKKTVAIVALTAAMALAAGTTVPAFARNSGTGGGGGGAGGGGAAAGGTHLSAPAFNGSTTSFNRSASPSGFSKGHKHGWSGANFPPGWSHGEKRGWNGGRMPPGLSR